MQTNSIIISLILTIVIECLFGSLIFNKKIKKALPVIFAMNLLTNPLANLVLWLTDNYARYYIFGKENVVDESSLIYLGIVEIMVIITETLILRKYLRIKFLYALFASFTLNLLSFLIGPRFFMQIRLMTFPIDYIF